MLKKLATIIITFCVSGGALADIFKFVDSSGRVTFTNVPDKSKRYELILKTKTYHMRPAPAIAGYRPFKSLSGKKQKFTEVINAAAFRHQVDPKLVHAVIQTESAYNANAVSRVGAVGLMQLMPDTARRYGVTDRHDPDQNVDGGTHYLRDLIQMFSPNLALAVAAYNAGENAVIKYNYSIPPYPETRNYVKQVLAAYNRSSL